MRLRAVLAAGVAFLGSTLVVTGSSALSGRARNETALGKIAFVRDLDPVSDIYVMNADGTAQRKSTRPTAKAHYDDTPAWSPGGDRIAFVRQAAAFERDATFLDGVYVMNANGRGLRRLTVFGRGSPGSLVWSPDGRQIVFALTDIYVVDVEGGREQRLTSGPALEGSPVWSPDGSQIAFIREVKDGVSEIHVMNANGTGRRRLARGAALTHPSWSRDGQKISFGSGTKDFTGFFEIFLMNADGGVRQRLAGSVAYHGFHVWSPDGRRLAYIAGVGDRYEVYDFIPRQSQVRQKRRRPPRHLRHET